MLNKFICQFPGLIAIERDNALKTYLALAVITLIEKLRHIIFHKGGEVDSVHPESANILKTIVFNLSELKNPLNFGIIFSPKNINKKTEDSP